MHLSCHPGLRRSRCRPRPESGCIRRHHRRLQHCPRLELGRRCPCRLRGRLRQGRLGQHHPGPQISCLQPQQSRLQSHFFGHKDGQALQCLQEWGWDTPGKPERACAASAAWAAQAGATKDQRSRTAGSSAASSAQDSKASSASQGAQGSDASSTTQACAGSAASSAQASAASSAARACASSATSSTN